MKSEYTMQNTVICLICKKQAVRSTYFMDGNKYLKHEHTDGSDACHTRVYSELQSPSEIKKEIDRQNKQMICPVCGIWGTPTYINPSRSNLTVRFIINHGNWMNGSPEKRCEAVTNEQKHKVMKFILRSRIVECFECRRMGHVDRAEPNRYHGYHRYSIRHDYKDKKGENKAKRHYPKIGSNEEKYLKQIFESSLND
jgi:hypothetical protein